MSSHGQHTATTRAPVVRYSKALSYQPPPRPSRNPLRSTARAGTMMSPALAIEAGPSDGLSGSCGLLPLTEPSGLRWLRRSSRDPSSLQPMSSPLPSRGTSTSQLQPNSVRNSGAIAISLPIDTNAATVVKEWIRWFRLACWARAVPACRRSSTVVRSLRDTAALRQAALLRLTIDAVIVVAAGAFASLSIRVWLSSFPLKVPRISTVVCCTTEWLRVSRRPRAMAQ